MPLRLNGSTSGFIEIAAPAVADNSSIDLVGALATKWNAKVSDTAPSSPVEGDVWVDTTGSTTIPKVWTGSAWQSFSARATVSATTGSPTTSSYTSGGASYTVYKFTASGSITFSNTTPAYVDVIVAGGGSNGGPGYAGGAGGVRHGGVPVSSANGTITVTVGLKNSSPLGGGGGSLFGTLMTAGGSLGQQAHGFVNGAGGGGTPWAYDNASYGASGGAGANASGTTAGAGITLNIADGSTNVEYGKGGASSGGGTAPANTGSAGNGGNGTAADGVVIVRVRTA